jgi:hypothetical protein
LNDDQFKDSKIDFDELKINLEKVDVLTKKLVYIIATKSKNQQTTPPNQELYYKADCICSMEKIFS